ncbi:MAG: hypothetical protein SAK29_33890 [Scytonema sp. PMC 1069.18]|nr:hypothetical protein [Scytonema sp. PMC 1069.18]MEC4888197.1 hypothetical protein [Scytonema sp. PMC 1070.18]
MSSATSGRYQSRLFNFFQQQSRRWGEQFERTVRHLQLSIHWSIEALLYPVFLLIKKATESFGPQMGAGEQQPTLQFQEQQNHSDRQPQIPPPTDTAIQRVLKAVEILYVEDKGTRKHGDSEENKGILSLFPSLLLPTSPAPHPFIFYSQTRHLSYIPSPTSHFIRGIASNLENRNLVLVTSENYILDILTPSQQEKLQHRINDEVNQYWDSRRLNQVEPVQDETKLLPEIEYLLNKLTSGKKDNVPVLSHTTGIEDGIEPKSSLITYQGLVSLDSLVAKLETSTLLPIAQASAEVLHFVQTQFQIFFYGKSPSVTNQKNSFTVGLEDNQKSKILALIWGAVNYFFGKPTDQTLEPATQTKPLSNKHSVSPALLNSSSQSSESMEDPWLTMNDLFSSSQQAVEIVDKQEFVTSSSTVDSVLPPSPSYQENLIHYFKRKATQVKQLLDLAQPQKSPDDLTSRQQASGKVTLGKTTPSSISEVGTETKCREVSQQRHSTNQVEAKPDWIEIHAKTMGYLKHPLEIILEWLDGIMLWLEDIFMKILMFLKGFFGVGIRR